MAPSGLIVQNQSESHVTNHARHRKLMTNSGNQSVTGGEGPPQSGPGTPQGHIQNILFLQGLATPFYATLSAKLANAGHSVHRVHFCGGDWAFRGDENAKIQHYPYGGTLVDLPVFYRELVSAHNIDTVIVFGDCRPVHEPARELAAKKNLRFFALDEGYIRPGFVTMETYGTNGYSRMPKNPSSIIALAKAAPPAENYTPIATDMGRRVRMDLAANAATIRHRRKFPHYRSHRPAPIWKEAKGWINRGWNALAHGRENDRIIRTITRSEQPYFLVPLQLNSDYQIRRHSRFNGGMPEFIREVMASFAEHADTSTRLFFKNHPLDNGIIDYRRLIRAQARKLDIEGRALFASGGDLNWFLSHCEGAVLCNSTVGFAAIRQGTPIKILGNAIYDIEGLSSQTPLDAFWRNPLPPQESLAEQFLTVVETYTQVRGDLFSDAGIDRASDEAMAVIMGDTPRLPAD